MDNDMICRHLKHPNPNESGKDCKLSVTKIKNLDEKERKMREMAEKEKGDSRVEAHGGRSYLNTIILKFTKPVMGSNTACETFTPMLPFQSG